MLVLASSLDREIRSSIRLVVTARDFGLPARSATTSVLITVKDVNDNAPEFPQTNFIYSLSEDVSPGSLVVKIEADDKDEGKNGKVNFFIKVRFVIYLIFFFLNSKCLIYNRNPMYHFALTKTQEC